MPGEHLSPVIVLVSDGLPTDDVDGGIARLAASHYGSKAIRIAIAIGSDADLPTLQNFIGAPNVRPLRANNAEALVNSIRWAASAPLNAASMEGAGIPVSEHLAEGISSQNNTSGDLVW